MRVLANPGRLSVVVLAAVCGAPLFAQGPAAPPTPTSATAAKEVVSLLQARKLDAFAVRDEASAGHFIAVLNVPGVQLMVVSAIYKQPSHIDYRLYHKDYMAAYQDLRSGILVDNRVLIDDIGGDGLLPIPRKDTGRDSFTASGAS